ncbi:M20/M25/M40 family metallo-hydrolase [Duganella levis]|uniref:M20/M25/M40 family metallo-hydrolase n=1 Tax=Duganella levis TaxID=2692169 RepID=A0ABW9VTA0_9BURK|nr:M20/M25/M40 family metallo-hydrolase [Duganella levis]MYN24856.1 M20/M25/M40 family metallo-hydrolase [Duganella levis]
MKAVRFTVLVVLVQLLLAACAAQPPVDYKSSAAPADKPELDSAALISDLRTLSSPAFAGRLVGSDGSRLAQEYIKRRFDEIGLAPLGASHLTPFTFTRPARNGKAEKTYPYAANLIGQIRGSVSPERYMVVSAHYDHLGVRDGKVYLGADDNASGVAAMLAVAAHFKKYPPHNTIIFAAFDAEEGGADGANYFINSAPIPIEQVAVNLNFDMVSRNDNNEIFAAGTSYTPALKILVAKAAATSSVKVRLGHDSKPTGAAPDYDWTTQSDHVKFHERGIPFLYFGVEDHVDYHKPGDSFEKINLVFYAEVTRLLVSTAEILDRNLDTLK